MFTLEQHYIIHSFSFSNPIVFFFLFRLRSARRTQHCNRATMNFSSFYCPILFPMLLLLLLRIVMFLFWFCSTRIFTSQQRSAPRVSRTLQTLRLLCLYRNWKITPSKHSQIFTSIYSTKTMARSEWNWNKPRTIDVSHSIIQNYVPEMHFQLRQNIYFRWNWNTNRAIYAEWNEKSTFNKYRHRKYPPRFDMMSSVAAPRSERIRHEIFIYSKYLDEIE